MPDNNDAIYIFGHKNPDADAICSAIAYAAFKKAQGDPVTYIPARCGNMNARIDKILSHFNVLPPVFISDITPRIEDIMIPAAKAHILTPHSTCAEALEIIDKYDIRTLPVTVDGGHLEGLISIFHLGQYFIPHPEEPLKMSRFATNILSIVRALKAKPLNLVNEKNHEELSVRVGTMGASAFETVTQNMELPQQQTIIIVGSRQEIQKKSIESGIRLLIVAANLEVDPEIIQLAKNYNVSLIVSPYDSATTAWVIRSAVHVAPLIDKSVVTFPPEEKLMIVRRRVSNHVAPLYFVVNQERELLGLFSKSDIFKPSKKKIILVDHNELLQAVDGAAEVQIIEIIDHHRLGNPHTQSPIRFINEPLGSTSTIIASMYMSHGLTLEPSIAGILMGGLISDTLNLNGPTTTDVDCKMLPWLSKIAGINPEKLADMIFQSGFIILSSKPETVIESDCKIYKEGDISFSVSQVEELGFSNFWKHADELLNALEDYRVNHNLHFSLLLFTNINTQDSLLMVQGNEEFTDFIDYSQVNKSPIYELPGIVSRKKQLIPYISSLLNESGNSL